MAFCGQCGAQLPDNLTVCPSCGAPREDNTNRQQGNNNQQPDYASYVTGADFTDQMDPGDIQQNKTVAIFAYFGILFIIPLLAAPNSRFAKFHANQGLVLFLIECAFSVCISVVSWFAFLRYIVGSFAVIAVIIFIVLGVVNAANGEAKELPLIGKISIIK